MKDNKLSRRNFLKMNLAVSVGSLLGLPVLAYDGKNEIRQVHQAVRKKEWRNRQRGMTYRKFGNTGLMVSEIVQGTAMWENQSHLEAFESAFEKGVNYIDVAPAYKNGRSERLVGKYLKDSGKREKLFLSNKISFYDEYLVGLMNDVLKSLPEGKREVLRKQADDLIEQRGVLKPGYHIDYWPRQTDKLYLTYLRYVAFKEYGGLNKHKGQIKKHMHQLVEDSRQAVGTEYFDVLHCPHGVAMPEMLESENIREVLAELKSSGKIRFSAVSMHNDVAGNLEKAIELGHYNAAMIAYNIGNHASLERLIIKAQKAGMGIVAMKVANVIHKEDTPQWRIEKLNRAIGDESISRYAKAYLWALQNPNISCCVSNMITAQMVADNTSVVGRKVSLNSL